MEAIQKSQFSFASLFDASQEILKTKDSRAWRIEKCPNPMY
jgi:hypothetical protein